MRAWIQAIAIVGALLLGNAFVWADAPARVAGANDGSALSVEDGRAVGRGGASSDSTVETSQREQAEAAGVDLRELVRELSKDRGPVAAEPGDASVASPASDRERQAVAGDGEAGSLAAGRSSREGERLGTPGREAAESSSGSVFSGTGSMVLNTLTALGIVIGIILLLRWAWVKMSGQPTVGSSPVVEVLARTPVAPRNHILLVRIGGRILIVGDSSSGLRTLATVDDPDEAADLLAAVTAAQDNSISRGFNQLLGRFQGEYDPTVDANADPRFVDEGGDRSEHVVDRARDAMSGLMSRLRVMSGKGGGG